MEAWINAKELAGMIGRSVVSAQRIIAGHHYKKQPLTVKTEKSKKGKPTAYVLWDTTTNQPATQVTEGAPDDHHKTDHPATVSTDCTAVGIGGLNQLAAPVVNQGNRQAGEKNKIPKPALPPAEALPLAVQAQTNAVPQAACLAVNMVGGELHGQQLAIDSETGEIIQGQLNPLTQDEFEVLLHRKLLTKTGATKRSMAAYYRKQYAKNGVIPAALLDKHLGQDGRVAAGRKSTLDEAIVNRFIAWVKNSADRNHPEFITRKRRRISVFRMLLENEFGGTIAESKLYALCRTHNLSGYLKQRDDDSKAKPPSFWPAEPVGALIMMDGVKSHYFKVLHEGKFRSVVYIEFYDMGSRRLMAMHAYLSESSENSIDIFKRFLRGNTFVKQVMMLRPDNAGGFLNLKRPMNELNVGSEWASGYAFPGGFKFVDDYARAGEPQDKAHLEASHKRFHDFETVIINHFNDKISKVERVMTKVENRMEEKDVHSLNISLEELNNSGLTEKYMSLHNDNPHRFTENGKQRKWVPNERWAQFLEENQGNSFIFADKDINACTRYGYEKHSATITKKGVITFRTKNYYVDDHSLWSNQDSTKVTISLIDGHLAIFNNNKDGKY